MNYIEQINGFWIKSETSDLSGLDIAVYMSLLKYCNRLNWLNPFVCHWDIVCQTSKVSKNAYYKSIDRLELCGLIKYQKGVKNTTQKPKILILELKNKEGIIKEQKGNKEGIEEEQKGNIYKHLNNKQINKILTYFNSIPISDIDLKIDEIIKNDLEYEDVPPPTAKEKSFKVLTEKEFGKSLEMFIPEFSKQTIRSFFDYWTEKSPTGKMKFQLGKTWDSKKRLKTWKNNEPKFGIETTKQVKNNNVPLGPWNV